MKSYHRGYLACICILAFLTGATAQEQRSFNQNASRSNHTRAFQSPGESNQFSIAVSPFYSTAIKRDKDSLLFRGNGSGLAFTGEYFFGKIGISASSGFGVASADASGINSFLKSFPFSPGELIITKSRQQHMYFLAGPSARFGNIVAFYLHARGGVFVNNSGLVNIQQKGAQRPIYRNEPTSKSIFPGFTTGMAIEYAGKSRAWAIGLTMDYLNTRAEVSNLDARRGFESLKLNSSIRDIVAGLKLRYFFHPNGPSNNRNKPNTPGMDAMSGREAGSGLATGRRKYQPGQPVYGNRNAVEPLTSCGPVTQSTTFPDGTTTQMEFACPADAVDYNTRLSTNMTVPKQTQGATFGEKVNAGLQSAGSAISQGARTGIVHRDLAARNIISGQVKWAPGASPGIITNEMIQGKTSGASSPGMGTQLIMNTRDASTGRATGRRSRETGSGMATGRRQYQPAFIEGQGEVCNPCNVTTREGGVQNNPLFQEQGNSGVNPLSSSQMPGNGTGQQNPGNLAISLIDMSNGQVIAKTKTAADGTFFFSNLPEGEYRVKLSEQMVVKKKYDLHINSAVDINGAIEAASDEIIQMVIFTGDDSEGMTQKAGISTSRSNIRNKSLTIVQPGTGAVAENGSTRVLLNLWDGTTQDVTGYARITEAAGVKKVTVRGWNPEKKEAIIGRANVKEYVVSIDQNGKTILASQYDNGEKEEAEVTSNISHHPNVVQLTVPLGGEERNKNTVPQEEAEIWSPRSNLQTLRTVAAPFVPGASALAQPGDPIPGLDVKLGRNPGGQMPVNTSTDNLGSFEFRNVEAGDYSLFTEHSLLIQSEAIVVTGTQSRVQDHNSSRSNKSSSVVSPDMGGAGDAGKTKPNIGPVRWSAPESLRSILVLADMDGDGVYESDLTSKVSDEIIKDSQGQAPAQKTGVSTSRSNIRNRSAIQDKGDELYIAYGTATVSGADVTVKIYYTAKQGKTGSAIQSR